MSYHITRGTLPAQDLDEYGDTGIVNVSFEINPKQRMREKEGHIAAIADPETPAAYNQIRQVQIFLQGIDWSFQAEVVPTAAGLFTGLAAAAPGDQASLANLEDGVEYHGVTFADAKLNMVQEPKRSLSNEKMPMVDCKGCFYPQIAAPS